MRCRWHSFCHDAAAAALGAAKSLYEARDWCFGFQAEALECRGVDCAAMAAAHATNGYGRAHSGRHSTPSMRQHHAKRHRDVLRVAVERGFFQTGDHVLPGRLVPASLRQMGKQVADIAKRAEVRDLWNSERLRQQLRPIRPSTQ